MRFTDFRTEFSSSLGNKKRERVGERRGREERKRGKRLGGIKDNKIG